jgi:hypothetical protein
MGERPYPIVAGFAIPSLLVLLKKCTMFLLPESAFTICGIGDIRGEPNGSIASITTGGLQRGFGKAPLRIAKQPLFDE